ncbi:MAG: hypothetical protein J1E82_09575 [Muribaculaceae bacterium]|nr:hypothetical protein [Muribaculaceae bacterium]
MKLRYLFALPILATALMGCDEIEYSDAKPVENPQLPGISKNDFAVSPSSVLVNGLNLEELANQTDDPESYMVDLYTINVLTDALPANAVVSGSIQFAVDDTFDNPFNLDNLQIENGVVSVPLSSLIYTRSTMFGKDPRPYQVFYRIPVYVTVDGGQYKIGDKDYYFCDGDEFTEEGVNPGYTVEEAYYLVGPDGTSLDSAIKFEHSGYNIYDDTIFTVTAKFSEGNSSWIIVPQSVYESGSLDSNEVYGPQDAEALEGVLELGGNPGTLQSGKKYDFSINLSTLSYTISEIADFEYLYTPGNSNGWDQLASQMLYTDNFINYHGFAYLDGGFKFTSAPDWNGINYGAGEEEGTISTSGGDLSAEASLYWCDVNVDNLTYILTDITAVSMIGDFNDWNGDVELTPSDNYLIWTGTLTLENAGGWKFRMNNSWDINLGGTESNLVINGDNINSEPGTYIVTLDLSKLPYSFTILAQ